MTLKDIECYFSYAGGELRHRVSFLVSDDLPMDILLGTAATASVIKTSAHRSYFSNWDQRILALENQGSTIDRKVDKLPANLDFLIASVNSILQHVKLPAPSPKPSQLPPAHHTPPHSRPASPAGSHVSTPSGASSTSVQRGPKLTPPPMYSGEDPKVDVSDWVTAMQAYLGSFTCPKATKLGVAGLLKALQDRFADREQARKAADKIMLLGSHRFEGSLSKLYSLFESLTLTPCLEMSESDQLTHFLRAAPPDYSIALYAQGHKDWRSFDKAALDLESRLKVQTPSEGRKRPTSQGQRRRKGALLAADVGSDSDASQRGSPPSETASGSAVEAAVLALGTAQSPPAMAPGKFPATGTRRMFCLYAARMLFLTHVKRLTMDEEDNMCPGSVPVSLSKL
ncbi:hypothetical protein CBR_g21077 [Chara braunii]|uniref:Uncharacterized protein n=1 Tax=Chara braunii TaxID=69332 RepID=A0A388L0U6_CHABU|nr:hypothetical protein CBR_g21077 [Chara braunii]|eukprot:GBG75833.1 hypothetical protein CBR_g21077 [Chara braunii]